MTLRPLTVLYRGPLSSCNYGCEYCPFAKRHETKEQHAHDGDALRQAIDADGIPPISAVSLALLASPASPESLT
jgi:hypothetical protein